MTDKITRAVERYRLAKSRYRNAALMGPVAMRALKWTHAWWMLANKLRRGEP